MSSVLPVDYLCGTIAALVAGGQQRVGEDYDFVSLRAPTFEEFFKVMNRVSGGKGLISFREWHSRALEYAATHPNNPLARITTITDGHNDETAAYLVKGGQIDNKHVLGLDFESAILVDEGYIRKYLDRIHAASYSG
ncbi:hypothetical protein F4813DRAFT_392489 [Daldinia decipiens]|uniref:uncharacterized protein n=1 Tax=Daldinia decipiens TaxID=326647 RepID=UPI0020C4DD5D|nr:uncharacterized protein F4813DRAFT_392489 [Daldinia decipiens]KAI1654734.1 hypothetical protein F4813DRAFT_392489 [Daldinia decipiens]